MKSLVALIGLILLPWTSWGQKEHFDQGNKAYQDGDYNQAIEHYEMVLEANRVSAALYYNLGNAYYQEGALAKAILNYERALLLSPKDEEVQHNLRLAERKRIDRFESMPPNLFKTFRLNIIRLFSPNSWAKIGIGFLIVAVLGLGFYLFSSFGRLGFIGLISGGLLCLFALAMAYSHKNQQEDHPYHIVMSDSAYVKSGPGSEAEDLFILHAGTKVEQVDLFEDWIKLRLIDGKIGWLPKEDLKRIF